jgi:MFS transporter, Spinster family, sphingosine-1-phosphate transporter
MMSDRVLGPYGGRRQLVYTLALMLLFWNIFDGVMTYITPLVIEASGFSRTMVGVIYGFSSVVGACFDFLICKLFKNTHFRRMFMLLFLVCAAYPLLMWSAKSFWFFLFVMGVWGLYFDLYNFGLMDFVGRYIPEDRHASVFGLVQMIRALASILTPLLIGFIAFEALNWRVYTMAWIFLGMGFLFFLSLYGLLRNAKPHVDGHECGFSRGLRTELKMWRRIGRALVPVLCLTLFLFTVEGFFWTLGPLYAEEIGLASFGGLFLSAYSLPTLLLCWFIGSLTKRAGKKRTAFLSLLIGSLILSTFIWWHGPVEIIVLVFVASCFLSVAMPATSGVYADYIARTPAVEGEIQGIEDMAFNVGYIIGPLLSGLLADIYDIPTAFSLLGLAGAALAVFLLKVTPRKLTIPADILPAPQA